MRISRKAFLPAEHAWAIIFVTLILIILLYVMSKFLSVTQAKIFQWG